MTLGDARKAVVDGFMDAWEALYGQPASIPVAMENTVATPPDEGPWLRFTFQPQAATHDTIRTIGGARYLRVGTIFVQIFVPVDDGMANADALEKQVKDILEGQRFGPAPQVRCGASSTTPIGDREGGRWYQVNVATRFDFEEFR